MAHTDVQRASFLPAGGFLVEARPHSALRTLLGISCGCAVMALAAQVRVPVPGTDVPMTLQSFVLVLVGLLLPARSAGGAMVLYAGLGAAGFPVFAPGSLGFAGPTGGYLAGFAPAAWLIALLRGSSNRIPRCVAAGAAGLLLLFAIALAWRAVWFNGDVILALTTGFVPFAGKAAVELVLAAMLAAAIRRRSRT